MDREETIYRTPLHELDLTGLAELCATVARHPSANHRQSHQAHTLRMEWIRLTCSLKGYKAEAEKSLKKRMEEFLAEVPTWMSSGL